MSAASLKQAPGVGRVVLLTVLAFIAGTVVVFFATLFGTLFFFELAGIRDREGAGAMAVIFLIAPVVGLFGGIVSALWAGYRLKRKTDVVSP